jgi:hypothetical protein
VSDVSDRCAELSLTLEGKSVGLEVTGDKLGLSDGVPLGYGNSTVGFIDGDSLGCVDGASALEFEPVDTIGDMVAEDSIGELGVMDCDGCGLVD